jgi:hypothetical protein
MFAFLGAVIDARWARFERENRRDASLHAKDFMVGVMRVQILSVKETYSCTAAEVVIVKDHKAASYRSR